MSKEEKTHAEKWLEAQKGKSQKKEADGTSKEQEKKGEQKKEEKTHAEKWLEAQEGGSADVAAGGGKNKKEVPSGKEIETEVEAIKNKPDMTLSELRKAYRENPNVSPTPPADVVNLYYLNTEEHKFRNKPLSDEEIQQKIRSKFESRREAKEFFDKKVKTRKQAKEAIEKLKGEYGKYMKPEARRGAVSTLEDYIKQEKAVEQKRKESFKGYIERKEAAEELSQTAKEIISPQFESRKTPGRKVKSIVEEVSGGKFTTTSEPISAPKGFRKSLEDYAETKRGQRILENQGFLQGARMTASTLFSEKSAEYISSLATKKKPEKVVAEQTGEMQQNIKEHGIWKARAIEAGQAVRSVPGRVGAGFIGGKVVGSGLGAISAKSALGAKVARTGLGVAGGVYGAGKALSIGQKAKAGETTEAAEEAIKFGAAAGGFYLGMRSVRPKLSSVSRQRGTSTLVKKGNKLVGKGGKTTVQYVYKQPKLTGGTRTITRTAEVTPEVIQAGDKSFYQAGTIKFKGPKGYTLKTKPYVTSGIKQTPRGMTVGAKVKGLDVYQTKTELPSETAFGQSIGQAKVVKQFQEPIPGKIYNVRSLATPKGKMGVTKATAETTVLEKPVDIGYFQRTPTFKGVSGSVAETTTGASGLVQVQTGQQVEPQLASNIKGMTSPKGGLAQGVAKQSVPLTALPDMPIKAGEGVVGKTKTEATEVSAGEQKGQQIGKGRLSTGQTAKIPKSGVVVEPATSLKQVGTLASVGAAEYSISERLQRNLEETISKSKQRPKSRLEEGQETFQETAEQPAIDTGLSTDLATLPQVTEAEIPKGIQVQQPRERLLQKPAQIEKSQLEFDKQMIAPMPMPEPKPGFLFGVPKAAKSKMPSFDITSDVERSVEKRGVTPDILSVTISQFQTGKATTPAGPEAQKEFFRKKRKKGPLMTFPTVQERTGKAKFDVALSNGKKVNFL